MKKRGKVGIRVKDKKALSPVITTVLLIALVVILATIIFLWARGFIKEAIEKEIGGVKKTAEKFCPEVNFESSISGTQVSIINRGNIPLYKIDIKKINKGSSNTEEGAVINIGIGQSESVTIEDIQDYDEVIMIPILLGKSQNEEKEYACSEKYGVECIKQDGVLVC